MIIKSQYVIYDPEYNKYVYYASTKHSSAIGINYSKQPKPSGLKSSSDELLEKFHKIIDAHITLLKDIPNSYEYLRQEIKQLQQLKANFQIHRLTTEVYTPYV